MKAQTKALVASVAVLALLLSTVGGVTYSWFADTRSTDIETGSAEVSYGQVLTYDGTAMGSDTILSGDATLQHTLKVTVTNTGTVPVVYSSGFIAERYSAYTAGSGYTSEAYIGDYKMNDGSLVEDTVGTKGSYQSGDFQNSLRAFQVEVNGAFESIGTEEDGWTIRSADYDSVYGKNLSLTKNSASMTADVKYNAWRISNDDLVLTPGEKAELTFVLAYQKTVSDTTATYDSSHPPTIRFVSSCVQIDGYEAVQMTRTDGTVTGSITVAQSHAGYVFYDGTSPEDSDTRIVIGWNAIDIGSSVGQTLTVTISDVEGGKTITVSGDCTFRTSGSISYTLDLETGASSVYPMDIPMTVWKDGSGNTLVSFSDSVDVTTHTISYTASEDP